ncbi:hypothetical protein GGR21_000153 [Dysgonomonas hofstadii]|uniref:Outer membrane protein beta-barrel domain-containing protein n=1 Tax=Dysgonomonas hofstadii TaxID=637886 RepID=A0A840CJS4_9BACT|nr:outer membrane beta-barrel protein [Dysgonomonas hofstadii]MBB4034268.1 hypothetical protein [Dysgonomonas hofstadii]
MKKIILLILTAAIVVLAVAQDKQEISVYLGAGSSSLNYDLDQPGDRSSQFGPLFGIGYTYKLNSTWGLVSGLEMAIYKSEFSSDELKDQYMTQDNYGNNFEWRLALHNLKDSQKGTYLNVPVMVQFTPSGIDKLYVNLGIKVGIPLSGKYESEYTKLVTSGYYPETGAEYTDIDFRGFGEFDGMSSKGDLDLGVAFMLAAECGMKWSLSNSMNLYIGGYVDYGLNNIVKENGGDNIIPYEKDNPTTFRYNSLMNSKYSNEESSSPFIDKVVPLAFGLKVKLGFSL